MYLQAMQTLAIFDLDNTLLAGDSDHAWGEFLIARGLVDATSYRAKNDAFYQDYLLGKLDINAYLEFALAILAGKTPDELRTLHADFMQTMIAPMMLDSAAELLQKHRDNGDYLLIITATNEFVTSPIARQLGVDHLLAICRDDRAGDIDMIMCKCSCEIEQKSGTIAGVNFDDCVNLRPDVVEGNGGRHLERAFAFLDLVTVFQGVARHHFAF